MLPSDRDFSRYVGGLGVQNDSAIVVYDGSGGNLSAARAWWMFRAFGHDRVALLDGGFGKWQAERQPVETGEVSRAPRSFEVRLDRQRVRDLDGVRRALAGGETQVVDMRSPGRFAGSEPEPRPGLSSGHMPGALNLPYTELVHVDGTMLSDDALRAKVVAAGIRLDRPVIATCGSGTSACSLLLGLHRLGHADAFLYDGSWTEWATHGMPIERGGT
jgi:thiosulfate/3-mercaptopyruvate sulfurtransferase